LTPDPYNASGEEGGETVVGDSEDPKDALPPRAHDILIDGEILGLLGLAFNFVKTFSSIAKSPIFYIFLAQNVAIYITFGVWLICRSVSQAYISDCHTSHTRICISKANFLKCGLALRSEIKIRQCDI